MRKACLKDAFSTDVGGFSRMALSRGLPADPMDAFRQSGYLERITAERRQRNLEPRFKLRLSVIALAERAPYAIMFVTTLITRC